MSDSGKNLTQLDQRLAALAARVAVSEWRPEPGETLAGTLVGVEEVMGPFGPGHKLVIETHSGPVLCWASNYIKQEVRRMNARIGDLIAIKFDGKAESVRGTEYNRYYIAVDPMPAAATTGGDDAPPPQLAFDGDNAGWLK